MILKIKFFSLIFLSLMIVACGFQLRGTIEADFETIHVYGGSEGLNKHLIKHNL